MVETDYKPYYKVIEKIFNPGQGAIESYRVHFIVVAESTPLKARVMAFGLVAERMLDFGKLSNLKLAERLENYIHWPKPMILDENRIYPDREPLKGYHKFRINDEVLWKIELHTGPELEDMFVVYRSDEDTIDVAARLVQEGMFLSQYINAKMRG